MTTSPACFRLDGEVDVPPVVERLLLDVMQDGFVLYCCGGRAEPSALVASYEWEHYVDTVVIRGVDRVTAARVPKGAGVDVFAPEVVVWAYQGCAEWALRALLDLVHPRHPDAPTVAHPAPRFLHVPRSEQRPLTIRLPSPGRAGMRAARLAAAMTTADM
ncbi:MAG: hypothetical protein M3Q39_16315 [Actinomycetota bacterium]|nr:hypothetical protein [Actinomycetota bacterium]